MSTSIQTSQILIIGTNGTGKTTLGRLFLEKLNVPRKLVLTQHLDEWNYLPHNELKRVDDLTFEGQNWHFVRDGANSTKKLKHYKNGLLLFDDARRYLPAQTDTNMLDLYISRRQHAVHIMMMGHGFTQIPPQAFTFATDIFLFATRDNIDSTRKNTIQNYDQIIEVQKRVNARANDKTKCWVSDKIEDNWHYCEHIKY